MALIFFRRVGFFTLAVMFLTIAGLSAWHGISAARADAMSLQARWQVEQWRSGKRASLTTAKWEEIKKTLQSALEVTPHNAQLHDDLAYLYAMRALGMGTPVAGSKNYILKQLLLENAITNFRLSTKLRPTFPYSWAYLAFSQHQAGQSLVNVLPAFDKALQYGNTEQNVRLVLAKIAFDNWQEMDAERKNRLIKMIEQSTPDAQKTLKKMAANQAIELTQR